MYIAWLRLFAGKTFLATLWAGVKLNLGLRYGLLYPGQPLQGLLNRLYNSGILKRVYYAWV